MSLSSPDEGARAATQSRIGSPGKPVIPQDEAARARRERRLLAAQQLAGLGSWEWDVASNTVEWSDELYYIYGVEPGSFSPTFDTYLARVHESDRARVQSLIGEAVRSSGTFDFEERIVRPDGEIRLLRSVGEATHGDDGSVTGLLGVCQDITRRRAMEAELRRSEAGYRAMFELAGDSILVHDPATGAIVDANRAACELHGYTLEELRQGGLELISADPAPALREVYRLGQRAAEGEPQSFEFKARNRDGAIHCMEVHLARVTTPDGDRLLAVSRDVTERKAAESALKQAYDELERRVEERTGELARSNAALLEEARERQRSQQALQRSEEHFRALIENSSDVASILEVDGTLRYQSLPIQRLLGWTPGELTGRNALDFVHPDDVADVAAAMARLAAEPAAIHRVEFRYRHKDGSYRVMESAGRGLKSDDASAGFIINSRDITDRRAAEAELRLQTAVLRAQGEASIDGILVVAPDGHIVSWNNRFVELWHIPQRLIESRSDPDAIAWVLDHLEDPQAFMERVDYLYAHPLEESRDELELKDGRVFDRYSGPVRGQDGAHYGRVWWFRDITEQKRSQAALEQARADAEDARARAERADAAKSDFLSRMSHELRTPLNSIIGFAQLLQRMDLRTDQVKPVEYILKGGRHLLNLINEVLEIARIESNAQRFSLEPVSVGMVVQETVALIRPAAAERGIRLVVAPATGAAASFVHADRQRLAQVLLNLLSNAVKYSGPDGVVRIECDYAPGSAERIRIAVHDNGPGIPEEQHDRLFTPFERLGAEQSSVEGTGLGLALSRRLAEGMGGTLDFRTTVGSGSTFWVEFPRADDPVERLRVERPVPPVPAGTHASGTVLYVEDNLANLSLIESVMHSRPGIELIPALQGRIGLDLARRHAPDVILLDLHLPDLSGEEVLRRLKADPATRDVPVVFITADAMSGTRERLIASGATKCLTKPLDIDEFLATLDGLLGKRVQP